MANLRQNSVNLHNMCKSLHSMCKVYTTLCKLNLSLYTFCVKDLLKITHVHGFHASNVMWTRLVTLALGKLLSSSLCFWKFTRLTRILHDHRAHWSRQISTLVGNLSGIGDGFPNKFWYNHYRYLYDIKCIRNIKSLVTFDLICGCQVTNLDEIVDSALPKAGLSENTDYYSTISFQAFLPSSRWCGMRED